MRRNIFLVMTVLFAATAAIYVVALFQSMQAYERWKEARLEECGPELRPFIFFFPYISTGQGGLMVVLGALIFLGFPTVMLFLSVKHELSGDRDCCDKSGLF